MARDKGLRATKLHRHAKAYLECNNAICHLSFLLGCLTNNSSLGQPSPLLRLLQISENLPRLTDPSPHLGEYSDAPPSLTNPEAATIRHLLAAKHHDPLGYFSTFRRPLQLHIGPTHVQHSQKGGGASSHLNNIGTAPFRSHDPDTHPVAGQKRILVGDTLVYPAYNRRRVFAAKI